MYIQLSPIPKHIKPIQTHIDPELQQYFKQVKFKNQRQTQTIKHIMAESLIYPSTKLANRHRKANRLGQFDLRTDKNHKQNLYKTDIRSQNEICQCCGFILQEQELPLCGISLQQINNLGVSNILFFKTILNVCLLLTVMFVVYSIFTLTTNLIIAKHQIDINPESKPLDNLSISLRPKYQSLDQNAQYYYLISSWLGLTFIAIWGFIFYGIKQQISVLSLVESGQTNISDFSVAIERIPVGLALNEVERAFEQYFEKVKHKVNSLQTFKIQKYNEARPFFFNQNQLKSQQLIVQSKKVETLKQTLKKFIIQLIDKNKCKQNKQIIKNQSKIHFKQETISKQEISIHQIQNQEITQTNKDINSLQQKFGEQKHHKIQILNNIIKTISDKMSKQARFKTTAFITFETVKQRNTFLKLNNKDNNWLKFFKTLLCMLDTSDAFTITKDNLTFDDLLIEAAPQPIDINWGNIGIDQSQKRWRIFLTFLTTIIILAISFVLVFALSQIQLKNTNQRYISFIISIIISLINIVIIKAVQNSTIVQRLYTSNKFQISLAIKSILAQLLNSIVTPLIINYYIKDQNIYGQSGLAEDIFILGITNSFVSPIMLLINPNNIYLNLRLQYYNRPQYKLGLSQQQFNKIFQKADFQLGTKYVYIVNSFLFTCFFVSLQPILPIFTITGFVLIYWIQKYTLYKRSKRPINGADSITSTICQILQLGCLFYALGSLTWSIFLPGDKFKTSLVANILAGALAIVVMVFPYQTLILTPVMIDSMTYSKRRIYFPSEYDRLNPATKDKGVEQYKQFLQEKRKDIVESKQLKYISVQQIQNCLKLQLVQKQLTALAQINRQSSILDNSIFDRDSTTAAMKIFSVQEVLMELPKMAQLNLLLGQNKHNNQRKNSQPVQLILITKQMDPKDAKTKHPPANNQFQ